MDSIVREAVFKKRSDEGMESTFSTRKSQKSFGGYSNKAELLQPPVKLLKNMEIASENKICRLVERSYRPTSDLKVSEKREKVFNMETSIDNPDPENRDTTQLLGQLNNLNKTVKALEAKLATFDEVVHERDLLKEQILNQEKKILILKNLMSQFEKMKSRVKELMQKSACQKNIAENALKKLNCASFQLREQETDCEKLLTLLNELYLLNDELKKILSVLSSSKEFYRTNCNIFVEEQQILFSRLKQANLKSFKRVSAKHSILKSGKVSPSLVKSDESCLSIKRCFSVSNFSCRKSWLQEPPKARDFIFLCAKCKILTQSKVSHEGIKSLSSENNESQSFTMYNHAPIIDDLSAANHLNAVIVEDCCSEGQNIRQLPLKNDEARNSTFVEEDISKFCNFINGLLGLFEKGDYQSTDWLKLKDSLTSLSKMANNFEGRFLRIAIKGKGFSLVGIKEPYEIANRKSSSAADMEIGTYLNVQKQFCMQRNEVKDKSDLLQTCQNQVHDSKIGTENIHGMQTAVNKKGNVGENLQAGKIFETPLQKPVNKESNYEARLLEEELTYSRRMIAALKRERENSLELIQRGAYWSPQFNFSSLHGPLNEENVCTRILNSYKLENRHILEGVKFLNDEVLLEEMKRRKYVSALCKQSAPRETERKLLKYLMRKLASHGKTAFGLEQLNFKATNPEQLSCLKMFIDTSKLSISLPLLLRKFEKFPVLYQIFNKNLSQLAKLFMNFEIRVEANRPFLNGSVIILNLENFEKNEIPYLLERILPKKGNSSLQICFLGSAFSYFCSFTSFLVREPITGTAEGSNKNPRAVIQSHNSPHSDSPISVAENINLAPEEKQSVETYPAEAGPIQHLTPSESQENLSMANLFAPVCPQTLPVTFSFIKNCEESMAISPSLKKPFNIIQHDESFTHSTDLYNAIVLSVCSSKKMVKFSSKRSPRWNFHPDELIARYNSTIIHDSRLVRPGQKLVSFLHAIILSNSGDNFGPIREGACVEVGIISKSDTLKLFFDHCPVTHLLMFHHILLMIKINLLDRNSFRFINFLLHYIREYFRIKGTFHSDPKIHNSCFYSEKLCIQEASKPENDCLCHPNTSQTGKLISPELHECDHCFRKFTEKVEGNKTVSLIDHKISENSNYSGNTSFPTDPCCSWYCHSSYLSEEDNLDSLKSSASLKQSKILNLRERLSKKNWFVEISTLRSKNAILRKQVRLQMDKFFKVQNVKYLSDFEDKVKKLNQLIEKHQNHGLKALEKECEKKIVNLKSFYDRIIDNITKRHNEDFKSLCKNYTEKLKSTEEIYERNIESMDAANISVLRDYEFHYETKVREWQSMILLYSQNVIDLQSIISKCKEEYLAELSNIENKYKVLIHDLYQCFDKEKIAVYVLLSETMDTLEMSYAKDIEKISAKVDREAAVSHAYFVQEIERCRKKYEHNLRKQKKSYKILLEEGRKSLMKKEQRRKMLTFSEVFNFDLMNNEIVRCADQPSSKDSLNSINENQRSWVYMDDKFFDQLSARKLLFHGDSLHNAMKKLCSKDSFQDFELCELLALYQEICRTILKHFQIPDSQQTSQENAPLKEISRSHSITSEMHYLRMRIVQLETILVKNCIERLKIGDEVGSVLLRET